MLCASNMNFTIVIPFVVAVRIKGLTLSFPSHDLGFVHGHFGQPRERMQSTQTYGDDKRHGYRGLYPLRAANLIHPDRVEARKGSIARLRLEGKPGDQTKL
jgi:hypothetical protein